MSGEGRGLDAVLVRPRKPNGLTRQTTVASSADLVTAVNDYFFGASGGALSFSVAVTEGADVLAADVSPIVDSSVAVTEGADILAAAVGPVIEASVDVTEGADVLAASVGIVSSTADFSSATTDGADVLAAAVSPVISASSATTDGADVLAAVVSPIVGFSSATTDGADVFAAAVDTGTASAVGGYDDKPKKKRFVVKVGDRIVEYGSAAAAVKALDADTESQPEPVAEVLIRKIKAQARVFKAEQQVQNLFKQQDFEAMLSLYEQMQDEDDIETLLMLA